MCYRCKDENSKSVKCSCSALPGCEDLIDGFCDKCGHKVR